MPNKNILVVFSPEATISVQSMLASALSVLESLPKHEELPKTIIHKIVSLEDMIERLSKRIEGSLKMSFGEFAKTQAKTSNAGAMHSTSKEERVGVIVSFLAMLELVKVGIIDVTQRSLRDDIEIETKQLSIPNYN